jgi:hypothetical protein
MISSLTFAFGFWRGELPAFAIASFGAASREPAFHRSFNLGLV